MHPQASQGVRREHNIGLLIMINHITATDSEARRIANGERVMPQPSWGPKNRKKNGNIKWWTPPFAEGAVVGVRERWASKCGDICEEHLACIRYEAGYDFMDGTFRWEPAETMPDWAIRSRPVCVSCVPVLKDKWGWGVTLERGM